MRWFFAACDLFTAALVGLGVFRGLPARWLPVDLAAGAIALALLVAAVAHASRKGARIVRWACGLVLMLGMIAFALLALSASHLAGVYGPIGEGSALVLLLVAALVVPYLIALPAAQIMWTK